MERRLQATEATIKDILIIDFNVFKDNRGYFFESYNQREFARLGITEKFVQDNHSYSRKNTIRGLHYQIGDSAQGKLIRVVKGRILDVAVDIRFGSPNFGSYFSIFLDENSHKALWIPVGFAHGFAVHSDYAIVNYKCTEFYSKINERSIIYNDAELAIDWGIENPIISEKDLHNPSFKAIEKNFIY